MTQTHAKRDRAAALWAAGHRIHPQLRAALKAAAALEGVSLELKLHTILCNTLNRPDLAQDKPVKKHTVPR